MRTQGRQAARRGRPHAAQVCPFHGRGRRGRLAILAGAPPVNSYASGVDTPPARTRSVPLVWSGEYAQPNGTPLHLNGPAHGKAAPQLRDAAILAPAGMAPAAQPPASPLGQAEAVELMRRIKAARSWQQLQGIVDENLNHMNHLHVSAVVTHMAQLHVSSSSGCSERSSSNNDRNRGIRQRSNVGQDEAAHLYSDVPPGDELLRHLEGVSPHAHRAQLAVNGAHRNNRQQGPAQWPPGDSPQAGFRQGSLRLSRADSSHGPVNNQPEPADRHDHTHSNRRQRQLTSQHVDGSDAQSVFLTRLESAVLTHLARFEGRQLANTLWGMAKLGHRPSERWLELVLGRASAQMDTFNPQHLANTLYALMLLRYMPPQSWLESFCAAASRRLHGFGPAELSHLCYAAGKLGLRPDRGLLGGVLHHSAMHIEAYGMRELALLLYGVVNMGAVLPSDWLRVYRKRVCVLVLQTGTLPVQLLEKLAAAERQVHPELAEAARAQLALRLSEQQPQHQPRLLRPGRVSAPTAGKPAAEGHALNHGGGGDSAVQNPEASSAAAYLPTVLLGLAEVGYRPPPMFMSVVLGLVGSSAKQLTTEGLTTVLLSLANMRYRPHPALFSCLWNQLMDSLSSLDTQQCTIAVWAAATLECQAPKRDVAALLMNAAARLPEHSDSEVVQLLEAVSGMGFEPSTSWLELIDSDLYNRLPRMRPDELAQLLLPLANLGHKPHRLWMARWSEAILPGLRALSLRHLATAACGAARLGFRPPPQPRSELLSAAAAGLAAALSGGAAAATSAPPPPQLREDQPAGYETGQVGRVRPAWTRRLGDRSSGQLPETLTRLLWALAVLDIRPDGAWVSCYLACLRTVVGDLSNQQRAQVAWAVARLRLSLGQQWEDELAQWRANWQVLRRQQQLQKQQLQQQQALVSGTGDAEPDGRADALRAGPGSRRPRAAATRKEATSSGAAAAKMSGPVELLAGVTTCASAPGPHMADIGTSNASGVDVNTLVLQGIQEWAVRQLGDPALEPALTRGNAVALEL